MWAMPCRLASLSHEVTSAEGDPTPRPSAPGPPIGGGNAARLANSSWDMHTAPLVARVHLRQAMWQWTLASDVGPCPWQSTTMLCAGEKHTFFLAQCTTMQPSQPWLPAFAFCVDKCLHGVTGWLFLGLLSWPLLAAWPLLHKLDCATFPLTCVLCTVHTFHNLPRSDIIPPSHCLLPLLHASAA